MDPAALVGALGSALPALILAAVVSIVGAIVAGIGLLRERVGGTTHPNPGLVAMPVAIPLVVAEIVGIVALRGSDRPHGVAVAMGAGLVALLFALPSAGILALFGAVAGGRGAVRRWRVSALVFGAALLPAIVTLVGGIALDDVRYPVIRAGLYTVMGLFAALAHLGADEAGAPTSPEAAAAGGAVLALVVGAGEASARSLETVFLLAVMTGVSPEARVDYIDLSYADVIAPAAPWHAGALALGCAAGALAIGLAARSRPSMWAALALVVVAVALGRLGFPDQAAIASLPASP